MKFFFAMLGLQLKRLLRRPSTLLCLLAAPLLALALGLGASSGEEAPIQVGVLLPEDSRYAPAIWDSLSQSGEDLLFVRATSQEQLENQVAGGDWECGYLLPQNLDDKLDSSQYARLVVRVDGPASSLGSVLDWSVASAVLDSCAATVANAVLEDQGVLPAQDAAAYEGLAQEMFTTKSLLTMEVVPVNGDTVANSNASLTAASLVRGMLALMLLLFGCLCAVWFSRDMQAGFFTRLQPYEGVAKLYLPSFAASAVLAAGVGLLCLAVGAALLPDIFGNLVGEGVLLLLYLLPLGAFSFFLSMLFTGRELLVCLLPFLMVACLILCPILVDLTAYLPWLGAVSAMLPPTGYLRAAASTAPFWFMPAQAAVYGVLGLAAGKLRKKL